jgi:pimeloyl-ACP methyl ester carboxylesterase
MLKEQTFNTDVTAINYAEGPPSGPPLVLLHGGGDRWQNFLPILPSLAMRWHIFALDLRGHGKSGRVPHQYRPEDYVADVTAFLERRLSEPAILFGHSLGGWVALLSAARLAERVRALILGDPPLNIERFVAAESTESRITQWRTLRELVGSALSVVALASKLADLYGGDAAQFRGWAKTLSQADPDAAQYHAEGRIGEYVENVDIDAALEQVACPVLLLQADPSQGGMVSDGDVEHALSLLADGLHVKLEGAGHDLGLITWEVTPLLRAVTDFLESL